VVGLQDERVLVEDDYTDYPDFVTLVEASHGYPATSLQWQPSAASSYAWSQKSPSTELLATTGDALRVWEYSSDAQPVMSGYVGRQPASAGHRLTLKTALSGVRAMACLPIRSHLTDNYLGSNRKCKPKVLVHL
jgi:WD repeat-containing protein 68